MMSTKSTFTLPLMMPPMPLSLIAAGSSRTRHMWWTLPGGGIEHGGRRLIGQDENSIQVRFMFALDQPLADYQFVYRTPSLIIRQPMHFTLKNIDLP